MTAKTRVIFVCTANAARSQMAEGLLQAKYGDHFEVFSAGSRLSRVSIHAIQVMQEIGIDISNHRSKTLDELAGMAFDLAVTLLDRAHQVCPVNPAATRSCSRGIAMFGILLLFELTRRLEHMHLNYRYPLPPGTPLP
jgi:arsenate reductase